MYIREFAQPTDTMLLTQILDMETGESVDLQVFLSRELGLVIKDRAELASRYARNPEAPWLVCHLCAAPVILVRTKGRRFHFRHHPAEEIEQKCTISTRGQLSADQINCMKYNAAKESTAHLRLKGIIRDSLIADDTCSEPLVEVVWKGMRFADRAQWRKPDVQVEQAGQRIAFEVQLSTTYLTEIVGRREFYHLNNGAMIWIFQDFDPSLTRTSEEDIFYLNNYNVFVVNEATLKRSRQSRRMAMDCWFATPELKSGQIFDRWVKEEVFLDQLTINAKDQKVYYNDYDAARAELEGLLSTSAVRQSFYDFWFEHAANDCRETDAAWIILREKMRDAMPHLSLPFDYRYDKFHGMISIMLSARFGRPVGYNLPRLLNVANTAFDHYKEYLYAFGWTLRICGHEQLLKEQDTKGTWTRRTKIIKTGMENHDEAFRQETFDNRLLAFLVPEIRDKLAQAREW
ncbi:DUF6035 family protein [Pseudomonas putida]|uniref:DUF6035 family protein n=1 Tax=Pseudomonas putida TaxID=303 RepID=UPI0023641655|nr:DUF6035 family protein [Pseudomonas putida]MDD2067825.1 DUF6035 family protein [Pseudomonas putida]HDS1738288.1 hypothetical protein [Pseudomonas putida]